MRELLGDDIVKGTKLNCSYIISKKPIELQVAERAIPVSIFFSEESTK